MSLFSALKNLRKNISYLTRIRLHDHELLVKKEILQLQEDYIKYDYFDGKGLSAEETLDVMDMFQTVDLLKSSTRGLCRFGDGEFDIMMGHSIAFQKYDRLLQSKLFEILSNKHDNLYVGVPYIPFHNTKKLLPFVRDLARTTRRHRVFMLENASREMTYIDTGFSQVYLNYNNSIDFKKYFDDVKTLFEEKDIVIFAGAGILDKLKYDVFELCASKKIIDCPKRDAFDKYESILMQALGVAEGGALPLFILGPTSTVLAYEMYKKGKIGWDIGHIAKDYNSYKSNSLRTEKEIREFFLPD